ncbi:alpha/beta fold hydrolase [Hahella sp. NBU794]|uniref:alpha/beta fold hydrolase n=1 Tax=Hahella sp. NBU794 TaxID=3422590 RepID=UPI003D6E7174
MSENLHCWAHNPKQNNAIILFVHGGPGSHSHYFKEWLQRYPIYSEHFGWISYDQRGCGLSAQTPALSHQDNVDDLIAVIHRLSIRHPGFCAVVGHSYGARLLYDALKQDDAIETKAVFLGRSLRPDIPAKRNFLIDQILMKVFQRDDYATLMQEVEYDIQNPASLWSAKQAFRDKLKHEDLRTLFYWSNFQVMDEYAAIKAQTELQESDEVFKQITGSIHSQSGPDEVYDFASLKQDSLHIMGAGDFVMAGDTYTAPGDNAYTARIFSKSGHYPHLEEPEPFIATLERFLLHRRA